jgi:prepilin-type N-terminal cleavage/methylation domain-containing protein
MQDSPGSPGRESGYTMIELLTVLALIMILASMAGPSMRVYVEQGKAQRALDRISGDLTYARALAVRSGQRTVLQFEGADVYSIQLTGPGARTVKRVRLGQDYAGVRVSAPTPSGALAFDSRGLVRDAGSGRIVVSTASVRDSAFVTLSGRIYRAN